LRFSALLLSALPACLRAICRCLDGPEPFLGCRDFLLITEGKTEQEQAERDGTNFRWWVAAARRSHRISLHAHCPLPFSLFFNHQSALVPRDQRYLLPLSLSPTPGSARMPPYDHTCNCGRPRRTGTSVTAVNGALYRLPTLEPQTSIDLDSGANCTRCMNRPRTHIYPSPQRGATGTPLASAAIAAPFLGDFAAPHSSYLTPAKSNGRHAGGALAACTLPIAPHRNRKAIPRSHLAVGPTFHCTASSRRTVAACHRARSFAQSPANRRRCGACQRGNQAVRIHSPAQEMEGLMWPGAFQMSWQVSRTRSRMQRSIQLVPTAESEG
jgi:hypothetical protein